ncbi:hypothetical protein FRC10_001738 [Ceratobasidium sp. 414]|nr:hypothetical protein FRC10_001738 [Ceratobasidium sp. 414]
MSHNELFADSDSDGATLPTPPNTEPMNSEHAPPTSGPEFFEWRRNQWRNARPKAGESTRALPAPPDSTSHARLETIVTSPGYEYNDTIWNTYLKNVNERLKGGVTLRKPLPLWVVIRILRVGWMRDGTWFGPGGVPGPAPPLTLETSSAMTETPALTPTAFLSELSTPISVTPVSTAVPGRVYASRRTRAPGWNSAALEVERVLKAVEGGAK